MIALIVKVLLTLSSFGYSVYLFGSGSWGWGIVMVFVTAIIALTIFRNEWILLTLVQLRQQNQDKALKYLSRIKQPQYLIKRQRAYYYYLSGLAGGNRKKMSEAEQNFRKALNIGLKQKHDQAMAKLNIAAICLGTGRRKEADLLLSEAKKLDEKGMLTDYIKDLRKQMGRATSRNQMRMAQMAHGKKGRMR